MPLTPMDISIENHRNIEKNKNTTDAYKFLSHYFEVTNNGGPVLHYNDNLSVLLANLERTFLNTDSDDIKLCFDLLKSININKMSKKELLESVKHWSNHKGNGISHERMISYDNGWTTIELLGQLWLLYNDEIIG